jgi:predicted AlkP superfamily pyrophosphatase or phosphodiesterase
MNRQLIRRVGSVAVALYWLSLSLLAQTPARPADVLKPTVILISVDGYRADYFQRYPSPALQLLARRGVRARWLEPAYPSLTFPNHYTIATGLYPDHHGIVANNIYDPEFKQTFTMAKREEVQNGRWWLGEPIWVTAEKQEQRAGAFFFPGTEAEIRGQRPTFWKEFDDKFPNFERVDTVLSWLALPAAERPTLITLYFSDVDHAGHDFGPDSAEVRQAIATVDASLGRLVAGLKTRGQFEQVNLIIVSDHGMARWEPRNVIMLDDYFELAQAETVQWSGAMVNIFPKADAGLALYESLKAKVPVHVKVYRKQDLPARFHYGTSRRTGEIIVMADEGWQLARRDRYRAPQPAGKGKPFVRGMHGFDHQLASMRAFFLGHGPAFKRGRVARPFPNVDVYHVMARILGLQPAANDGSPATASAVLR